MNEIINITNGQNIIDVIYDGFIGCLKIEKSVAYDKFEYDREHDRYKYFWLNNDHRKIDELYDFKEVLIFGSNEEVKNEIYSFLNIFSSGQYKVISENLNLKNFDLHKDYYNIKNSNNYFYGYDSKMGFGPFNREPSNIMFTMLYSDISYERIIFYKGLIEKGLRPKIIATGYEDILFILDGHHKLLAYQLLDLPAEIISIIKLDDNSDEEMFNLLLDCQFLLSDDEKKYIFSNQKIYLLKSTNEKSLKYNLIFDNYLQKFLGHLSSNVFRTIIKAVKSDEEEERALANEKLDIIRNRDFESMNTLVDKMISNGMIGNVKVHSKEEFDDIVEQWLNNLDSIFFANF